MPVVNDASPILLLAKIGKLSLLKELYSEIVIPIQVRDEVDKYKDEASFLIASEIENGWIKLKDVISGKLLMRGTELCDRWPHEVCGGATNL